METLRGTNSNHQGLPTHLGGGRECVIGVGGRAGFAAALHMVMSSHNLKLKEPHRATTPTFTQMRTWALREGRGLAKNTPCQCVLESEPAPEPKGGSWIGGPLRATLQRPCPPLPSHLPRALSKDALLASSQP